MECGVPLALLVQLGPARLRERVATPLVPGMSGENQLAEADADAEESLPRDFPNLLIGPRLFEQL